MLKRFSRSAPSFIRCMAMCAICSASFSLSLPKTSASCVRPSITTAFSQQDSVYLSVVVFSLGHLFCLLIDSRQGPEGPGLPVKIPPLHLHTQILQRSDEDTSAMNKVVSDQSMPLYGLVQLVQ